MLKRNIAMLIAGGLLSAQVGLAAADQGAFPSNDTEVIWKLLPAQVEYFKQREASNPNPTGARGDVFPPSADTMYWEMLPAQVKYFAQREASNQTAACGNNPFPPSADDQYWQMLPAQAKYFEQREASRLAKASGVATPRSC